MKIETRERGRSCSRKEESWEIPRGDAGCRDAAVATGWILRALGERLEKAIQVGELMLLSEEAGPDTEIGRLLDRKGRPAFDWRRT